MSEPMIAAATGYAGGTSGPVGPLIELAMRQAVEDAMALGVADDTPPDKVAALLGIDGVDGATYIRNAKLAARRAVKDQHRALTTAHESAQANVLHSNHAPGE